MLSGCVVRLRQHAGKIAAGLGIALTLAGSLASDAEARRYRRHHYFKRHHTYHVNHGGGGYVPAFSAMVVDVNSGRTLYARDEDELRHPASITKVMTLYLLFEQLEKGRFNLETPITVSARAHRQAPSKLGLEIGETIQVEDAIKALVTKSANDIAVAIAEAVGGDEDTFADMMTRKAHALGMSRTVYRNASGLPNDAQVTTARDLTILGRAIQERFPRYYRYFSTHTFNYAGASYPNHNKLLGRIEGVDGIKTGYTRGSGFNLLTSAHRGSHHIVSVILGGRSGRERDRQMASLVENTIDAGSSSRTASQIAEVMPDEPVRVAIAEPVPQAAPARIARTAAPVEIAPPQPIAAAPADRQRIALFTAQPVRAAAEPAAAARPIPPARPVLAAAAQKRLVPPEDVPTTTAAIPQPPALRRPAQPDSRIARADAAKSSDTERPAIASTGMMIQIGASDDVEKATELLSRAKAKSRTALASAKPFTEKVQKGDTTLYRARFAGLDAASAQAACQDLIKSGFACFTTHN